MRLGFLVALRYLISKKGTNFINIISGMTVAGLSIGTAALIIVLSVFNGFEDLIAGMINTFNPDIKVLPKEGKYFDGDQLHQELIRLDEITAVSQTIEETAFFEYDDTPSPGTLKGIDRSFVQVNNIDSSLIEGIFLDHDAPEGVEAVVGSGLSRILAIDVLNVFKSLTVFMARRKRSISKPFKEQQLRAVGVFSIQQEIDNEYVFVPLEFAQGLLDRKGMISALEIKVHPNIDSDDAKEKIAAVVGDEFHVLDLYEQDEEFLKIMNVEKWMAYAIASLMILLISFNLVGCLWMIVLDKQKDIAILRAMGGTRSFVHGVFVRLGLLYTGSGLIVGIVLAVILYALQTSLGLISIPQGFVVDAYPIRMKASDVLIVGATVIAIGWLASLPSARRARAIGTSIRDQ
ncbi:MAG: ABC transporter permease [Saprospiraceae bacterium]|nr:ABC transporter permease [Saprospiraceae bacterium]